MSSQLKAKVTQSKTIKLINEIITKRKSHSELPHLPTNTIVCVAGWVLRHRDQGGCIFIDLRDDSAVIQLLFDRNQLEQQFQDAEQIRDEYVLYVKGKLQKRAPDNINPNLPKQMGEIEILVTEFCIGAKSKALPISVDEYEHITEEKRLRYRFLDLRRSVMHQNLKLRSRFQHLLRCFLIEKNFTEIQTPILGKPTPEGARDFLVPVRPSMSTESACYALPQSPQLLKQILMLSGYERYFQIAHCFRDEDLRADRQPEFTQLDIEMSFINEEILISLMESMLSRVLLEFMGIKLSLPLPRMTYAQAMRETGSDKPDLSFGLRLADISDLIKDVEFSVFRNVLKQKNGSVQAICCPASSQFVLSRKNIDDLIHLVIEATPAKGLAWMKHEAEGLKSNITKFFLKTQLQKIAHRLNSKPGDVIFFVADTFANVLESLGFLRTHLAQVAGLKATINKNQWQPLWVTEFPLFNVNDAGQLEGAHHPFALPSKNVVNLFADDFDMQQIMDRLRNDPWSITSRSYDLVLNGVEIGGGSMRNDRVNVQRNILTCLGIEDAEQNKQFGFLLEALEYGSPLHGGIAFGLDRLLMTLLGKQSLRDVIAFPKTQKGHCLLTTAPSSVSNTILNELGLHKNRTTK